VNNAGITYYGKERMAADHWDQLMPLICCRTFSSRAAFAVITCSRKHTYSMFAAARIGRHAQSYGVLRSKFGMVGFVKHYGMNLDGRAWCDGVVPGFVGRICLQRPLEAS
jgi:hypothetical protein